MASAWKSTAHLAPAAANYMLIAFTEPRRQFCTLLFFPFGKESFASLKTSDDVMAFHRVFPTRVPLMPTLAEDFFKIRQAGDR